MNETNDSCSPGFGIIHQQISELKKQNLFPSHILLGRLQVEALTLAVEHSYKLSGSLEGCSIPPTCTLFGFKVVEADAEDLIQVVSKEYFDHLEERTVVE